MSVKRYYRLDEKSNLGDKYVEVRDTVIKPPGMNLKNLNKKHKKKKFKGDN